MAVEGEKRVFRLEVGGLGGSQRKDAGQVADGLIISGISVFEGLVLILCRDWR